MNLWDNIAGTPEEASMYMASYGEGIGCDTRMELGSFIYNGDTVLDVGCGPAWNYEHFKVFGPSVKYKGLDYSQVMIDGAKLKYPEASLALGDVRNIKELADSWDVVIMQDVLEHTNGYEKPIEEALRVASKRVIVAFWHLTENDDHINDDGNDGWGAWYSKPKWEAFLDALGYKWIHHQITDTKARDFYVIYKEKV